jgi:hypothetical protein
LSRRYRSTFDARCQTLGLGLLLAAVCAPQAASAHPSSVASASSPVTPVGDSWVRAGKQAGRPGRQRRLVLGRRPRAVAYLRFRLPPAVAGSRARLELHARSGGGARINVHRAASKSWSERRLRYRNRPRVGKAIGRSARFRDRTVVSVDLPPSPRASRTLTLALTTRARRVVVASRENRRRAPRLVPLMSASDAPSGAAPAPGSKTRPPQSGADGRPPFPIRAAFYYPWFPETWTVGGAHVFYRPALGYYDSSNQAVVDPHIRALDYAHVEVAIASWWGPATHREGERIALLLDRTRALRSPLKWSLYYEREGSGDPNVAEIQSDLAYLETRYASRPEFAKIGGAPVIFV